MDIQDQLFEGKRIRLGPIDHEKDADIEAKWTEDPEYLSLVNLQPVRPLAASQVKKNYEAIEKKIEEDHNLYYFTIHLKAEGQPDSSRLIGFARVEWIDWPNSNGFLSLGIGDPADRGHGYGTETLQMLIYFAFSELNLFRLTALIPEYNAGAIHLFTKAGFVEEARRRDSLNRAGQRWDQLFLGLLRSEWEAQH